MEQWPRLTPVRHKTENYQGWIDGITRMESCFTGNTDCEWQYRIITDSPDGKRKIAPTEDLEQILEAAEFPPLESEPKSKSGGKGKFKEETPLHQLGYQLTDMAKEERWKVLQNVAVPILGVNKVTYTVLGNAALRVTNEESADRYRFALIEWYADIKMLFEHYPDQLSQNSSLTGRFKELTEKLLEYKIIKP